MRLLIGLRLLQTLDEMEYRSLTPTLSPSSAWVNPIFFLDNLQSMLSNLKNSMPGAFRACRGAFGAEGISKTRQGAYNDTCMMLITGSMPQAVGKVRPHLTSTNSNVLPELNRKGQHFLHSEGLSPSEGMQKIFSFRTPRRAILKEYLSFESPGNYVFARIPEVRSRHKALLTPKSKAGFLEAIRDRIFQGTMLPESGMSGDCIPSDSMIRSI